MEDTDMKQQKNTLNAWDRIMAAISFAEAGETETAMEMLNQETSERIQKQRKLKVERPERIRPELRF